MSHLLGHKAGDDSDQWLIGCLVQVQGLLQKPVQQHCFQVKQRAADRNRLNGVAFLTLLQLLTTSV